MTDEKATLMAFLTAQRDCVRVILDGLGTAALTTAVLPSGWTPLGMVEHLGYAERHWFGEVMLDAADPVGWPDDDHAPLTTPRPPEVVFGFYRDQCARSDAVVAATPLDTPPKGRHPGLDVTDLRWVILHMIEETARHAGHLDVVRELLDGTTGLAPR
jgi:hypothetical protein